MKQIALLLFFTLLLFSFIACGDTNSDTEGNNSFIGASGGFSPNQSTNSPTDSTVSPNNGTSGSSSGDISTNSTTSEKEYGNEVEIEAGNWADLLG